MGFGVIGQFRVEYPVLVRASGEELGRVVMLGIVKQLVQRRNMPRTYGRGKIRLLGDTDFVRRKRVVVPAGLGFHGREDFLERGLFGFHGITGLEILPVQPVRVVALDFGVLPVPARNDLAVAILMILAERPGLVLASVNKATGGEHGAERARLRTGRYSCVPGLRRVVFGGAHDGLATTGLYPAVHAGVQPAFRGVVIGAAAVFFVVPKMAGETTHPVFLIGASSGS